MIKKDLKEKIAVLSIALMLASSYAVSATVTHLEHDFGISKSFAETLISLPSFLIFLMAVFSEMITRKIGMRRCVLLGLSLMSISSVLPVAFTNLYLIFLSRILLGLGIGLFIAHSANYVNQLYTGLERERLQGIRNSMEYVGQIVLLFFAGILIKINWKYSFLVYLLGLFIFIGFYFNIKVDDTKVLQGKIKINKNVVFFMLLSFFSIMNIVAMTVRLPSIALMNIDKYSNVSLYISLIPIVGMISSLFYGRIFAKLKNSIVSLALIIYVISNIFVAFSQNYFGLFLVLSLIITIAQSMLMPFVFSKASDLVDENSSRFSTNMMFASCNFGAFSASIFINLIAKVMDTQSLSLPFIAFSICFLVLLIFYQREFKYIIFKD